MVCCIGKYDDDVLSESRISICMKSAVDRKL